jgi:thioesterase domain-containing protein/aryl carrier-like protein
MASAVLDLAPERIIADESLMNFGVDSIMLADFVTRLNHAYQFLDVNQAEFFEHSTIAAMAEHLVTHHEQDFAKRFGIDSGDVAVTTGARRPAAPAELVTIQSRGTQPASFWVPGSYGFSQSFLALPRALGDDFPIHAFHARGNDGRRMPFSRLADMAAHYASAMRTVQPEGPYLIGGYSFGGLVALEMAQQVIAAGGAVAGLVLFDTYPPTEPIYQMTQNTANQAEMNVILANYLTGHGERSQLITASDLDHVPERLRVARLVELIVERGRTSLSADDIFAMFKGSSEVNDYASEAYRLYRPAPYNGSPVLYVKAGRGLDRHVGDYDYLEVWRSLVTSRFEVVEVAFPHSALMTPDALAAVMPRLAQFIAAPHRSDA